MKHKPIPYMLFRCKILKMGYVLEQYCYKTQFVITYTDLKPPGKFRDKNSRLNLFVKM